MIKTLEKFDSVKAAWYAAASKLEAAGATPSILEKLRIARSEGKHELWAERLASIGAKAVACIDDVDYPEVLRHIHNPPAVLFVAGTLSFKEIMPAVALVGSRKATPYGENVAKRLAADLGQEGISIISGLARGIDTSAHKGAIAAKAKTAAVLGTGLDQAYPRENRALMSDIQRKGLLISEFPPGVKPLPWHFPLRNRIISGLVQGVVVIEATGKSGALITADLALEQNREVFAVPGNIDSPYSVGPNNLIKEGAKPVMCGEDVLEELGLESLFGKHLASVQDPVSQLNKTEVNLLHILAAKGMNIDALASVTGLTASELNTTLSYLELKGFVHKAPGGLYYSVYRKL